MARVMIQMRTKLVQLVVFCFPLLGASPSLAQPSEGLSLIDASLMDGIWTTVFVIPTVSEGGTPGGGVGVLVSIAGLDQPTAEVLFLHVESSIEAWKQAGITARNNMCAHRQQIVTKEDYMREMEKRRKASTDARTLATEQIAAIVDNVSYAKIVEASRLQLSRMGRGLAVDLAERLAAEPEDTVAKRLERDCSPARLSRGQ